MATDEADGLATVADRPSAKLSEATEVVASDPQPTVADRPGAIAGGTTQPKATLTLDSERSLTTAADALHDEEVERTRLFIRMGWGISAGAIGTVPLLPAPLATQIAMVAAMLV